MEDTFAQISQRVEIYYTGTVVPSGKTIAHYDQLVADIATKKQAVDASLAKVKSDADAFSCDQDPKGQVNAFRTDMRQTIDALKRYRTSVKNLIVAVRSVTGETNRTASPRPQVSPKGANHE